MLGRADRDVVDDHEEERALVASRDEVEELLLGHAAVRGITHELDLSADAFLRELEDGRADGLPRLVVGEVGTDHQRALAPRRRPHRFVHLRSWSPLPAKELACGVPWGSASVRLTR